jgi:phosphate transport system substrate-binding protein
MTSRSRSLTPQRSPLVCKQCGYDANPETATQCEVCETLLRAPTSLETSPRWKRNLTIAALALSCLGLGGYLFWRSLPPSSTPAIASGSSTPLSQSPDIRFYNAMKNIPNVPQGLFNYGGAFLFATLASHGMNDAITQTHPGFRLRYTEPLNQKPGSGTGIEMLTNSQLSFAQSGRPLKTAEYRKAKNRGFSLETIPVAIDGVAFFTHPNLKIPGLSLDQAQGIFRGTIQNWKAVGGPDLKIVPVSLDPTTTSTLQVLFEGLKDATLSSTALTVRDYTAAIRTVATTPGAISYASAPSVVTQKSIRLLNLAPPQSNQYVPVLTSGNQVNAAAFRDGSYPFTRRLFVVIRRDGTVEEQAGVAYANAVLSPEGQRIIEKAGFVAIR